MTQPSVTSSLEYYNACWCAGTGCGGHPKLGEPVSAGRVLMGHQGAAQHVHAPFTSGQVASLNGYQASGAFHEFTCGGDGCPAADKQPVLVAAEDGWHCPSCTYTQDWAHGMMADGSWQLGLVTVTVNGGPPVRGEIVCTAP